jgi:hypothetical protein
MTKVQKPMTKELPATKHQNFSCRGLVGHSGFESFLGHWSLVMGHSFAIRHSDFVIPTPRTVFAL